MFSFQRVCLFPPFGENSKSKKPREENPWVYKLVFKSIVYIYEVSLYKQQHELLKVA